MKTKINRKNLKSAAVFLSVVRLRIHLKTNTASRAEARSRAFCTLLLCGAAAALWAVPTTANAQLPQLGNYPDTTVQLGANSTVTPTPTPFNTMKINVSISTNFKGLLEGNPTTGVVRVTNAHPTGVYPVTVTAFSSSGATTKTFTLTVTRPPPCNPVDQITFSRTTLSTGTTPRSVAIGDFNGDGIQDLAIAVKTGSQGKVSVFLGKGTGGTGTGAFPPPGFDFLIGTSSSDSVPNSVAVGDFDRDGRQDIATANSGSDNVSVLLNRTITQGNPVFAAATNYPAGGRPRSIAVGDFNGDHKQDLAVTNEIAFTVSVFLGDGNGVFTPTPALGLGSGRFPRAVAIGDFNGTSGNGDTKPDIAVTTLSPDSKVRVFVNNTVLFPGPVFTFNPAIPFNVTNDSFSVTVGDFNGANGNGDGKQDLATANGIVDVGGAGSVSVLLNTTTVSGLDFMPITPLLAGINCRSVAVGQFDNLSQDLVVANYVSGTGTASILLNDGSGGFQAPKNFPVGTTPFSVAVGDFNGDGRQDLAVANFVSNNVSILLRQPCPCAATFSENFDVPPNLPPNLPTGWTAMNDAGPALPKWAASAIDPDTVPNDAFVGAPVMVSDKSLYTPGISISSASAQLSFRNHYCLEDTFDGGVLEIFWPTIPGGNFTDIIVAGGSFITGGYNATINPAFNSPIAGRMAWSGNSCCYICTVVNLPAAANGQTVKFRFRMGSDSSIASNGWRIDKVQVSNGNGSVCCSMGATPVTSVTGIGNVSTRMGVQTGDNVGIGAFIVTGSDPKHLLLRAIGPSLAQFGVPGALADPVLELHGPDTFVTITNNNWRDDPAQEAAIIATGIPPTNDLESAIDATLAPGAYTAIVRGNANTSGVALVEAYDLDQGVDSKLANISTRAFVSTGDNIVIAGFTLGNGDGDDRIVVRGIGPSLTAAGVPNALADPTLELRDSNGALLSANNDWQDDPAQAAELTAAGLAPTNNLESGIAVTLSPGPYTALLAGQNNGTGVGLVEVYDRGAP
jgi:hypothetical protein